MEPISRFVRLAGAERRVLACALVMLPAQALALRLLGLRRCLARAESGRERGSSLADAHRISYLVDAAANRMPGGVGRCLVRSMVLCRLLLAHGYAAKLALGVRIQGAELQSHAWVELDGVPVNAALDVSTFYTRLEPPGKVARRS